MLVYIYFNASEYFSINTSEIMRRKTNSYSYINLLTCEQLYKMLNVLFILFVFIFVYWCPTLFSYLMMFVSFNSNTTGVTCGTGTDYHSGAPEIFLGFRGLHVAWSLVFYVMFCRWLFVLLLMAIVLYWLLITPLVSSHLSFSLWSVC